MIDLTWGAFPHNVVHILAETLAGMDPEFVVLERPLRPADPNYSIGVFGTAWEPVSDSEEMGGTAPVEPTLSVYNLGIQSLVKHGDSQKGLVASSVVAKHIRTVLYRNQPLRGILGGLTVTDGSSVRSLKRWGVRNQRYMNNDLEGAFVFVSTLDYWIETEMR